MQCRPARSMIVVLRSLIVNCNVISEFCQPQFENNWRFWWLSWIEVYRSVSERLHKLSFLRYARNLLLTNNTMHDMNIQQTQKPWNSMSGLNRSIAVNEWPGTILRYFFFICGLAYMCVEPASSSPLSADCWKWPAYRCVSGWLTEANVRRKG